MIISVSRRCDIPRFQFDRFRGQLDAGFADTVNPFNGRQIRRVSLLPQDVDVLVFWTRDPRSILEYADELERRAFRFYVMTTLTGYPALLEPNLPSRDAVIDAMRGLAEKLGPARVIWRYDPVFLSSVTDGEFHRRNFAELAERLEGAVRRVIISVYDEYQGAVRRLAVLERAGALRVYRHTAAAGSADSNGDAAADGGDSGGGLFVDDTVNRDGGSPARDSDNLAVTGGRLTAEARSLLADLADTARRRGMAMQACAEGEDLSALGIKRGACIDGELIRELWGIETRGKAGGQRPFCRCAPSVDIGRYGPCPAGCVYCYARR
jgi:predicted RecB family endonuclease